MKPQKPVVRSALSSVVGFVLGTGAAQNAFANPHGATVVHGSAQFATPGANTLEITNSANAIINWQSFGIGAGETTRFIQPSAASAVLNRVTGADVSELLGNLSSNGRVFLINPHGIVVGENAVIDVAGFVASTLNLSDEDFLNGRLDFQGENAGALINRGLITAGPGGELVLIAPQIENHGVLSVDDGALLLAAGEKVTLTRFDLNGIEFEVRAPDDRVLNLGELIARRGAVGVFAGSIDQRGIVEADAVGVDAAGNIVLQARNAVTVADGARVTASGADGGNIRIQALDGDSIVSGDVEAAGSDGKGGGIRILGERVGLLDQANIDASGARGGGEISIGGDYRGSNPEVRNASGAFLGKDVRVAADATIDGDGGKVVVWADEAARVYGGISATGGPRGGDGGFVETSAHYLEVAQGPDVSAKQGNGGTWLLDPYNIEVVNGNALQFNTGAPSFTPSGDDSQIGNDLINAQLNAGTDVILDTAGGGSQAGNVTFNAGLLKTTPGDATLTVRADGDIIVNANILADIAAGRLNIDFESNRNLGDGLGGIQFAPGIGINTNDGSARFVARGALTGGSGVVMNSASAAVNAGDGEISIRSEAGNIDLTGGTFAALLSNNKVTLEADGLDFTFGAVSTSTGSLPEVELRSFSVDVDLGTSTGSGLLVDDALLGPINAGKLVIGSAAGRDVRAGDDVLTLAVDTTIDSGRDIIFNNSSLPGMLADDVDLTLNAAGSIIDGNPGSGIDIDATVASSLTLQAAQGIQVEVNVPRLRFSNTAGGDVGIINRSADPSTLLLGGANGGNGDTTIDYASDIEIAGNISHGPGRLTISSTGIVIDNGVSITGGGGDIQIRADDFDLAGGLVDAGAGIAGTVLTPLNPASWTIGGTGTGLGEADLDAIRNNIFLGGSLLGVDVAGQVALTHGQNLTIYATGDITFNQNGDGIQTAGDVALYGAGIVNGLTGNIDVAANRLTVSATSGIDLETQLNELTVFNDDNFGIATGSVNIVNSGSDLTISAGGAQNLAFGGDVAITNTSGSLVADGAIYTLDGDITLIANAPTADIVARADIRAEGDIALSAGRDLIVHAGPGSTTHARVFADNTLNLAVGRNLALAADTAGNVAAIVSDGVSSGTQNGIQLQAGDILLVGGTTSAGLLDMSGGTATFGNTTSLGGLTLTGGVLGGAGNVNVSGATVWSGGSMAGTGVTTAQGGLDISGSLTLNRTLSNAGTGTWHGTGDIGGTGAFSNQAGASLDIANDQSMTVAFSNAGTVTKSSTGTTQLDIYTQTGGTITSAGTLAIDTLMLSGGVMDGTGGVVVPTVFNWTGGTLGGTGTTTSTGSLLIDGAVTLNRTLDNKGSAVWQGTNDIAGTGTFNNLTGAAFHITNDRAMLAAFDNAGTVNKTSTGITQFSSYHQTGGASTFAGQVDVNTLDLDGGSLDGDGNVNVATTFNWNGGTMAGGGATTSNGNLSIDGAVILNRALNNAGNATWQGAFDLTGTGAFNNQAGGHLAITNDQSMAMAFSNAGTVVKSSAGTTQFGAYTQAGGSSTFSGTVAIDTLALSGGALDGDGTVNVATALSWTGGSMAGTGTTTVDGSLLIGGAVALNRTLNNDGSGVWQGASDIGGSGTFNNLASGVLDIVNDRSMTATFNNAGTVNKTSTGATTFLSYSQTGGTATFAGTVGVDTLNLGGGTLTGNGAIDVATQLDWTGGTMAGTGTTTSNGGLLIDGAVTLDRTLNNAGNGVWQGAGDIGGAGVLNNAAGGVFRIDNDRLMSASFDNAGLVDKTSTGTTSFAAYRQVSGVTRLNGGTLQVTGGELVLSGGVLTGTGTVTVPVLNNSGGWIAPGGYIDPTSQTPTASDLYGSLTIDGDLQMGSSARIDFDLGVSNERGGVAGTDFDLLAVTGNAQLNGELVLVADPVSFNAFVGEEFRPVITHAARSGAFSSLSSSSAGYQFSPTLLPQGMGVTVTAAPPRGTDLTLDGELEALRDELEKSISRLAPERECRKEEEEEEREFAMTCS